MQILPSTWQTYGDGGNIMDPADAIPAAARILAASGAPGNLQQAIFAYNHSGSYVQLVLSWAARYAAGGAQAVWAAGSAVCQQAVLGPLPGGSAGKILAYAEAQLGKPYIYGATGPDAYDCSGLAMMAYRAAGIVIPRTAAAQWAYGTQIPARGVRPGDLVFFAGADGTPAAPGHVGIVLDPAAHTMIDAYATGYPVEEDTYGLPASKGGLSPVVGFGRPCRFSIKMSFPKKDVRGLSFWTFHFTGRTASVSLSGLAEVGMAGSQRVVVGWLVVLAQSN